ncbi:hypothetical protein [Psychrobacillus sp. FJAT-21963]|uniref:hypothetical protein n=1 Tax=Psychrobacillus sp. FJAT-21963 TaxID=1712028 RepID=UPI0007021B52|nr:hypothetical protein [Psychrobacillus sp. FJAT-21963]
MTTIKKIFLLIFILIALVACGTAKQDDEQIFSKDNKGIMDDFIFQLKSEKDTYTLNEPLQIYAQLEYVGESDEITIYHASSPFILELKELNTNFDFGYAMDTPLLSSTLKKREPLRIPYSFSGGYNEFSPDDYVQFVNKLMDGEFPIGRYVITGKTDFYIETDEAKQTYNMEQSIEFEVVEN